LSFGRAGASGDALHALRLTFRGLARQPAYALTAVLSLALGIGANTAIFSLLDQALLRPLPLKHPEELVLLYHPGPLQGSSSSDEQDGPSFSYPVFRALLQQQTPFTGLAGGRRLEASLAYGGDASPGMAHRVSGNYFGVLGVRAALGRLLGEEDDRTPGAHPVAVLSHRYWTSRWGADPSMLNETMIVNGHPMTIVGIAEQGFEGERRGDTVDIFVPISMNRELTPDWNGFSDRQDHWVTLFGRLKPGLTPEAASAAINVAYRAQLEEDIAGLGRRNEEFLQRYRAKRVVLRPGQWGRGGLRERSRPPLLVLMGMTLLVLFMACANVTSLQLARGATRAREVAVRLALGASRLRLVRHLLAESLVLAGVAALLGLLAAHWFLRVLLAILPTDASAAFTAGVDGRVLSFCLVLSAVTTFVFGLYPSVQASRPDLVAALKAQSGEGSPASAGGFFRRSLVTVQVAVSVLLLVCAGLFARTFVNLMRIDLGIQPERLLAFSIDPKLSRYTDARAAALYDELTARLTALPGVTLVSAARVPAIAGSASSGNITVEGFTPPNEDASDSSFNMVGPDYFRTMGIPLVAGREFTRSDDAAAPKVAIVNETFVRHFLAGREPLGQRFGWGVGRGVKLDMEIVGVVRDSKYSSMRDAPPPVYYVPYRQGAHQTGVTFYVRTAVDPVAVAPVVRSTAAAVDPNLPVRDLKTMQRHVEENVGAERLLSILTGSFAGLASLLAAIGLYGVLAYDVARRTREIGIRLALGARAAQVRGLVVRQVALLLAIGASAGLAAAAAAERLLQAVLFGTAPWDLLVYGSALTLVVVMALVAAYVPARRASSVDPMVALRDE
jgi:putative ABC transport system permease protein